MYSHKLSLSPYPGIANSCRFVKKLSYAVLKGEKILSIVKRNASSFFYYIILLNIRGINFYNKGLLSSIHGFVLISINHGLN